MPLTQNLEWPSGPPRDYGDPMLVLDNNTVTIGAAGFKIRIVAKKTRPAMGAFRCLWVRLVSQRIATKRLKFLGWEGRYRRAGPDLSMGMRV